MRNCLVAISMVALSVFVLQAYAVVDPIKAQGAVGKNMCFECHAVANRLSGPSYREIAQKYKGNSQAMGILVKRVKAGSSGVWGKGHMPPNKTISNYELKLILEWVLAGAPG